jgi:phosphotransferase system enzyme I (PtsI)
LSKKRRRKSQIRKLQGRALSPGLVFGTAYRLELQHPAFFRLSISAKDVPVELKRFRKALKRSRQQYLKDKKKLEKAVGKEHASIIDAHLLMLEDPWLIGEIEKGIRENLESPERSIRHVADNLLDVYHSLVDSFFKERSSDFEEVIQRLILNLTELGVGEDPDLPDDLILVASEIGLGVLARFPPDKIKGLVLTRAGETSHVAIIARSYQIPVVSGIENIREEVRTGDRLLIDGSSGIVKVGVGPDSLAKARSKRDKSTEAEPVITSDRDPCLTLDDERIFLYANTEFGSEVPTALKVGAEGIGLFRSEYVYMSQKEQDLDEEGHYLLYRKLAETVKKKPAVIRTLDIADPSQSEHKAGEEGSALGLRGIRVSLRHPNVFKAQVRSILRAREHGNLRIVLPMISSVDEVIDGRRLIEEVEKELGVSLLNDDRVAVGVLLEVPAAILTLEAIARYCDFVAVGTNDLIQYTLAAGRLEEEIEYLYNPLHPALLRCLDKVVKVAQANEITATVCGEMAAHPLYAAVLVGLGFRYLSMTSVAIPVVKRALRRYSAGDLKEKSTELMSLTRLSEITTFVQKNFVQTLEKEGAFQEVTTG